MKAIYFVRHGEAQANVEGVLAGSSNDSPLTTKGKQQAKETAALLAELPIELVITSPLSRATTTAQIIVDTLGYQGEVITSPLFTERDFCSATGIELEKAFIMLDTNTAIGAETVAALHGRVLRALDYLRRLPQDHILVVSHSGFGRMLGAVVSDLAPENFLQHKSLGHAVMYEFNLD